MSLPARFESIQYAAIVVSPTFTGFGENATALQRHRISREQGIDFPMTPLCCPLWFMDSEQIQAPISGGMLFDNFQTSQPDARTSQAPFRPARRSRVLPPRYPSAGAGSECIMATVMRIAVITAAMPNRLTCANWVPP